MLLLLAYIHGLWLLFAASCGAAPLHENLNSTAPVVTVRNGTYRGIYNAFYDQDFFLGIPYAQPPINDLRFRVAQSLNTTWDDIRSATAYPPFCYGFGEDDAGQDFSEDCLYLNVIRPSLSSLTNLTNGRLPTRLPVAVWIHGGGLFMGGTADQRFNTSFTIAHALARRKPLLVVSIQYRKSAWGFLGGSEALKAGVTNLGYRDQRLALRWVRENVEAFGGDRDRVTLWGESSGAQSVGAQMLAYGGRDDGLFHGAICQSGGPGVSFFPTQLPLGYNSSIYQETYNHLVSNTSCSTYLNSTTVNTNTAPYKNVSTNTTTFSSSLDCLRALPIDELTAALNISFYGLTPFAPIIDNDFITTYPSIQLSSGAFVPIPLLIGSNTDEGTDFATLGISSEEDWFSALNDTGLSPFSAAAASISTLYPNDLAVGIPSIYMFPPLTSTPFLTSILGTQFRRSAAYFGDLIVNSPRRASNYFWSQRKIKSWSYRFDVLVNGFGNYEGSAHFAEMGYVFYNLEGRGYADDPFELGDLETLWGARVRDLARLMNEAWINMIVDGDPNGSDGQGLVLGTGGRLKWPMYFEGGSGGGNRSGNWTISGSSGTSQAQPEGQNLVFTVYEEGSHVEPDTYRAEGMDFIRNNSLALYGL